MGLDIDWFCFSRQLATIQTRRRIIDAESRVVAAETQAREAESQAREAQSQANELFAREAASIQLQDALDRASSSETRATHAEATLASEQARYHVLEQQLDACETRATHAEATLAREQARYHVLEQQLDACETRARDADRRATSLESQLALQTHGISLSLCLDSLTHSSISLQTRHQLATRLID